MASSPTHGQNPALPKGSEAAAAPGSKTSNYAGIIFVGITASAQFIRVFNVQTPILRRTDPYWLYNFRLDE